ncbi:neuroplastin-like isoform X3 [Centruroides vittatus]|uniref:neuroplastin-like isoform X3 n=1 Tax=Centruroides vittatus TaxID=120091 RepID=UPI00350EB10F
MRDGRGRRGAVLDQGRPRSARRGRIRHGGGPSRGEDDGRSVGALRPEEPRRKVPLSPLQPPLPSPESAGQPSHGRNQEIRVFTRSQSNSGTVLRFGRENRPSASPMVQRREEDRRRAGEDRGQASDRREFRPRRRGRVQLRGGVGRRSSEGNEAADRRPDYDERLLVMPGGPGPNAVLYVDRVDYSDRNRYTCLAENAVGQAEASVWVTVRDNMIKTNEAEAGKGLILLPGKQLVLQCETTVCVNCTVEWLKDGEHLNKSDERIRIHDANNSLIISKARVSDTGDYMCFVNKSVIGEFVNATIVVRPKTQVEQFDKSINLVQGNKLNLHCNVKVGIPVPTISWYKDGQLLNGSDDRIGFSEDDKGIPNAILTIDELEYTDRANYMCEADNGISSSNATTLVRVKDKLAALWPFLGICAEVIILCTIIFIYEKKKVKEVNNPDVDQIAESRNVPERGRSQEIRQRK